MRNLSSNGQKRQSKRNNLKRWKSMDSNSSNIHLLRSWKRLAPPVGKEEPVVEDEVQERSPEHLDQPSMPPSEPRETEPMVIESHIEVSEEKPDESLPEEPRQPSIPPPEPQWMKLASLESLPKSLELEISQFLPIYTMQFHNCTAEAQIFVAHTQICSLLGFTESRIL